MAEPVLVDLVDLGDEGGEVGGGRPAQAVLMMGPGGLCARLADTLPPSEADENLLPLCPDPDYWCDIGFSLEAQRPPAHPPRPAEWEDPADTSGISNCGLSCWVSSTCQLLAHSSLGSDLLSLPLPPRPNDGTLVPGWELRGVGDWRPTIPDYRMVSESLWRRSGSAIPAIIQRALASSHTGPPVPRPLVRDLAGAIVLSFSASTNLLQLTFGHSNDLVCSGLTRKACVDLVEGGTLITREGNEADVEADDDEEAPPPRRTKGRRGKGKKAPAKKKKKKGGIVAEQSKAVAAVPQFDVTQAMDALGAVNLMAAPLSRVSHYEDAPVVTLSNHPGSGRPRWKYSTVHHAAETRDGALRFASLSLWMAGTVAAGAYQTESIPDDVPRSIRLPSPSLMGRHALTLEMEVYRCVDCGSIAEDNHVNVGQRYNVKPMAPSNPVQPLESALNASFSAIVPDRPGVEANVTRCATCLGAGGGGGRGPPAPPGALAPLAATLRPLHDGKGYVDGERFVKQASMLNLPRMLMVRVQEAHPVQPSAFLDASLWLPDALCAALGPGPHYAFVGVAYNPPGHWVAWTFWNQTRYNDSHLASGWDFYDQPEDDTDHAGTDFLPRGAKALIYQRLPGTPAIPWVSV